jgi:hypothetical protein
MAAKTHTHPTRRPRTNALICGLVAGGLSLSLAACGPSGSGTSLNDAPTARELAPTVQEFEQYVVHYNALSSDSISPQDATRYGIARSRSNALINVVMLNKDGTPGHTPVGGQVTARVNNLTGQTKSVEMRQISEGESIYFIGVVSVSNNETLNFNIDAQPEGERDPLQVKFQQQFFTK